MAAPAVAIVGGGVAGLSTAMHLGWLGAGANVTVLEARLPATGSSSRSVGDVGVLYEGADELAMRLEALHFLEQVADEVGLRYVGGLRVVDDPAHRARLHRAVEAYAEQGIDARFLEPDEIAAIVPDLRVDDLAAGLWADRAGHVDGALLCNAYLERAQADGVTVVARAPVLEVTPGVRRRFRLVTPRGEHEADVVVNAAGGWSHAVGDLLGAPAPVVSQRHQVCLARVPGALAYPMPQFQDSFGYVDSGRGLYLRPESATTFIAGLHHNYVPGAPSEDPDRYSAAVDADYVEALAAALMERFPGLAEMGLSEGWTGLYPLSPDDHLLVGPYADVPGVVAVTGLGGAGIQTSYAAGRVAAEWIVNGEPSGLTDPARYLPDRAALATAAEAS
ncbi:MAG TPA: FAD-dependent oxidoreductase [Conexibacter sp.]|jgi:sarcosine oxidase subunit beta|nr:FAD-dependent oxidoreductase [Conexibacter sp.]